VIELEKTPTKVNQPTSGTYGEKAANDRLAAALPVQPGGPPGGAPAPPPMTDQPVVPQSRPPGAAGGLPPGVPGPLGAPTERPSVPVDTPLGAGPAPAPVLTAAQQRVRILDLLANNPDVAPSTREWAESVRRVLIGR